MQPSFFVWRLGGPYGGYRTKMFGKVPYFVPRFLSDFQVIQEFIQGDFFVFLIDMIIDIDSGIYVYVPQPFLHLRNRNSGRK
jgi:hypothetical protein